MGACLVWVVTQAFVVSDGESQSGQERLRLLLPSVSVDYQHVRASACIQFPHFQIERLENRDARNVRPETTWCAKMRVYRPCNNGQSSL
jgi:hypothetical protein